MITMRIDTAGYCCSEGKLPDYSFGDNAWRYGKMTGLTKANGIDLMLIKSQHLPYWYENGRTN